jgi:CHAD domain-containing protein
VERRVEGVHTARKALKRVRAVLRLLERCQDDAAVLDSERDWYRDTGRLLQPLRDGDVLPETLRLLLERSPEGVSDEVVRRLSTALRTDRSPDEVKGLLRQADDRIEEGAERLEDLHILPLPKKTLCAALRATFRRAALSMELAETSGSAEAFHDWRKRAKELWYQAELLSEVCPSRVDDIVERLDELQNTLGHAQDLTVLLNELEPLDARHVDPEVAEVVSSLAAGERAKLWEACEARGHEIFPATPFG